MENKVATVRKADAGTAEQDESSSEAINHNREGVSCGGVYFPINKEIIISAIIIIALYIGCSFINLLVDFSTLFICVTLSCFSGLIIGRLSI